jgi:hypothetical protein
MSRLFDRYGKIEIIGDGETRSLEGLRFEFAVQKNRASNPNTLFVRIYNPSPDTRKAAAARDADVKVFAGYVGNNGLISAANITKAETKWEPPNVILEINAQEGLRPLRETTISVSHGNGATPRQVIDEIAGTLGLNLRPIRFDIDQPLRGGFAHVGRVSRALDDIVRRFRGSWSIQNEDLVILPEPGFVEGGDIPLINVSSGMIFSPDPIEKPTTTNSAENRERAAGWRVTSLMRQDIETGQRIKLEARAVTGEFIVDEIEHKGDIHGNEWYSILTCVEPG